MQQEYIETALRMSLEDTSKRLSEEMTVKNILSLQLATAREYITELETKNKELTQQLDEATKPEEIIEGE
ncbi:hypothetical protein [Streptococcus iners]|uniref:Phage protein n=1 Tax=Streptococcus iners subsp. hyiners TaxID=3028083 RepID=A0AA97A378_9STRE|nr:hypothetical protein [Streptococcus sp. 29892]MCK4030412.1 hypothetical protein [Streptococcus suis]WNY49490.1 hypothetical protein PW220_02220 [Streptococcus sp. 29892]